MSMAVRRFLAAFSVFILVLFVIQTSRIAPVNISRDDRAVKNDKLEGTIRNWFQCSRNGLKNISHDAQQMWRKSRQIVNDCISKSNLSNIKYEKIKNKDETKRHIMDTRNPMATSNIVTLGIGLDVKAESKMKQMLANGSHFYGADPVYEGNGKLFEAVGDFFPFAVGTQIDVSRAYVLMNGRYQTLLMPHIDIITFLKKYVKQDFIDQLLMDNEGPEYEIIPMMGRGREFDANELVVCQCNTEIHKPDNEKKEKFRKIMNQVMEDERYMILDFYSTNVHHRLFFVNVEHPYCLNRYIAQFYE